MQALPCFLAERISDSHFFGGCGALSLRFPIGGAANGTPRNLLMELNLKESAKLVYEAIRPSSFPYFVDTVTEEIRGSDEKNINHVIGSMVPNTPLPFAGQKEILKPKVISTMTYGMTHRSCYYVMQKSC